VVLIVVVTAVSVWMKVDGRHDADNNQGSLDIEARIISMHNENRTIAAGVDNSAWIEQGKVTVIGQNDYGQCNTSDWQNIMAVSLGDDHTMCLTADGRVYFAGNNSFSQCALDTGGRRAVSIDASSYASYAVLEDGQVVMSGRGAVTNIELAGEKDVAVVAASDTHVALLKKDGTVVVYRASTAGRCDVTGWKDIVRVDCGYNTIIALDVNGVVYVSSDSVHGQSALNGISGAVNVSAGGNYCIVAMADGSVIGAGSNSRGQTDLGGWYGITAVDCGYMHAVGVTSDGTRVFSGSNNYGQRQ